MTYTDIDTSTGSAIEVAPGVHAYEQPAGGWCVNNAGILVGDEVTAVIDTAATVRRAQALRDCATRLGARPVDVVVNTHFHGDHVFGNATFAPSATIVAHEGTRAEIIESGLGMQQLWPDVDWGALTLTPPMVTFRDGVTLQLGGCGPAEVVYVGGPAHTAHDSVVWLPDAKVLFTGDLVWSGVTPFCLMGSVQGSLRVLRRLLELQPVTVVPGHGPHGGPELIEETISYLEWIDSLARTGQRDGLSPLELALRTDLGRYAHWLDNERIVGNLARAYADADAAELGAPIDIRAAMTDMVSYHGGPLSSCA